MNKCFCGTVEFPDEAVLQRSEVLVSRCRRVFWIFPYDTPQSQAPGAGALGLLGPGENPVDRQSWILNGPKDVGFHCLDLNLISQITGGRHFMAGFCLFRIINKTSNGCSKSRERVL